VARETICMGCGQATGPEPRLNRLPDGRACSSCADRLLDSLPPLLPSPEPEFQVEGGDWAEEGDEPGDDFLEGA
jgi:hypothetical protein